MVQILVQMTPQLKAKRLVNSFYSGLPQWVNMDDAKMCAKKTVNEILNNSVMNYSGADFSNNEILSDSKYWNEVLIEIDKL